MRRDVGEGAREFEAERASHDAEREKLSGVKSRTDPMRGPDPDGTARVVAGFNGATALLPWNPGVCGCDGTGWRSFNGATALLPWNRLYLVQEEWQDL